MGQYNKNRNETIDFFRIIFSIIIVLYHAGGLFYNSDNTYLCPYGYIGVEFFFILSGYLLANRAAHECKTDVWDANLAMIADKFKSIGPYLIIAILISNLLSALFTEHSSTELFLQNSINSYVDALGLQLVGFKGVYATGVAWYLSGLFTVSFTIYPILCKKREVYTKYIGVVISLFFAGIIAHNSSFLNSPLDYWGIVYKGWLRAFVDITMGCCAYEISVFLKNRKKNSCMYILGLLGLLIPIVYCLLHKGEVSYDFFMIPLLVLGIALTFVCTSKLSNPYLSNVIGFASRFSVSVFLCHFVLGTIIKNHFSFYNRNLLLAIYLILVFAVANIHFLLVYLWIHARRPFRFFISAIVVYISLGICFSNNDSLLINMQMSSFEGNGSLEEPYLISTKEDLYLLRDIVNSGQPLEGRFVQQIANIDLQDEAWIPIGIFGSNKYFYGIYDGNNHYIDNLRIENTGIGQQNTGFFGVLGGIVINLGIENGFISGDCVGAIASHSVGDKAMIVNCYNKATVSGNIRAGGICDNFNSGIVIDCINIGNVSAPKTGEIVSYSAALINGVYPVDGAFNPDSFTGVYNSMQLKGESIADMLNFGIDCNKDIDNSVITTLISKW